MISFRKKIDALAGVDKLPPEDTGEGIRVTN
jgi:hypothetical protein